MRIHRKQWKMIKVQKKCHHCPSVSWRPSNSVSVLHVVIHGPTNLPAYFQALDSQPISQPTSKAIFQPTPKATFQPTSLHAWRNLNLLAGRCRQPWRRGRRNATTWEAESARISTSCCRLLSAFSMRKFTGFVRGSRTKSPHRMTLDCHVPVGAHPCQSAHTEEWEIHAHLVLFVGSCTQGLSSVAQ